MHGRFAHIVVHDQQIRKLVAGNGVALRATGGQRRIDGRRALERLRQLARRSTMASSCRRPKMPCVCDHTSTMSPCMRASAHEGPIEAWQTNGLRYSACRRLTPRALAAASAFSFVTLFSLAWVFSQP